MVLDEDADNEEPDMPRTLKIQRSLCRILTRRSSGFGFVRSICHLGKFLVCLWGRRFRECRQSVADAHRIEGGDVG